MSIAAASEPIQEPVALQWEKIAFYLRHAFSLFGDPAALAQRLWLTRRDHKQFADFIRPLEEIVRRVIFIMALELAPMTLPPAPERKYRARLDMPANAGAAFDAAQPETWRVSFRLSAERRHVIPGRGAAANPELAGIPPRTPNHAGEGAGAPNRVSSAPSAQRLKALTRAYENRDKLAAALARKIARNARAAHAYTARPRRNRAHQPVYTTLFELIPRASEAYQRFIHRKLDALLPDTS